MYGLLETLFLRCSLRRPSKISFCKLLTGLKAMDSAKANKVICSPKGIRGPTKFVKAESRSRPVNVKSHI